MARRAMYYIILANDGEERECDSDMRGLRKRAPRA